MQATADYRFSGDVALLHEKIEIIEQELKKPGSPAFEKVGNNCLVFFTNDRAKKVCEDNPETIQGVFVNDYDCWIHPEAVVIGSYLRGSVGSPARIDFGSKVTYSNVVMAHVRRSQIDRSAVSTGVIDDSVVSESFTSGDLRNMNLVQSMARVGFINDMTEHGQILEYDSRRDRPDTDDLVSHVLARHGLQPSQIATS